MSVAADAPVVEVWSDLHCPYAYLFRHRLRKLEPEYVGRLRFRSRALAIEVDTKEPTPKGILDAESPLIALDAPDLPYAPWRAPEWTWPATFIPAMEAVKCAELQDPVKAWDLDWRIRYAFFHDHACVIQRHVLAGLAEAAHLDRDRFLADWDAGRGKKAVLDETLEGWYARDFHVSPTLVLPGGATHANPFGPHVGLDADQNWRVTEYRPGPEDAMARLRVMLDGVAGA